jgi:protein-disulfide isomerase
LGRALLLLAVAALPLGARPAAAEEAGSPVVAVFDPQIRRIKLSPVVLASLGDYLAATLVGSGAFEVVPRDQLKQRLTEQKKRSYRLCYSQVCQIAIGKELAASKTLASRVMKIGKKCVVTATLYDLRKAVAERAATAEGACDEDALLSAVRSAAARLIAGKGQPGSSTVAAEAKDGTTPAPATGGPSPASPAASTSVGPADAKVRVEDFTDYQCPYCARSRQAVFEAIANLKGKVRYVHRDYPLDSACNPKVRSAMHPVACQAAYAARCAAEQGKFETLDGLLFQASPLDEQSLRTAIVAARLDEKKLDRCIQSPRTRQAVLDDIMLGVVRGVVGTPTLFVNGEKVSGARPVEFWEQTLRRLLR